VEERQNVIGTIITLRAIVRQAAIDTIILEIIVVKVETGTTQEVMREVVMVITVKGHKTDVTTEVIMTDVTTHVTVVNGIDIPNIPHKSRAISWPSLVQLILRLHRSRKTNKHWQ
jgi:hypothetical protein